MSMAIRTIDPRTIRPGESINVTVRITNSITKSVSLQETIPEGWILTRGTDNALAFKESTNEWVWTGKEHEMIATYTLIAPQDASVGTYQITGQIMHADGKKINVDGDMDIVVFDDVVIVPSTVPTTQEITSLPPEDPITEDTITRRKPGRRKKTML